MSKKPNPVVHKKDKNTVQGKAPTRRNEVVRDMITRGWGAGPHRSRGREEQRGAPSKHRKQFDQEYMTHPDASLDDKWGDVIARTAKDTDDPCWEGYEAIGMKDKDGVQVPNCVPVKRASPIPLRKDLYLYEDRLDKMVQFYPNWVRGLIRAISKYPNLRRLQFELVEATRGLVASVPAVADLARRDSSNALVKAVPELYSLLGKAKLASFELDDRVNDLQEMEDWAGVDGLWVEDRDSSVQNLVRKTRKVSPLQAKLDTIAKALRKYESAIVPLYKAVTESTNRSSGMMNRTAHALDKARGHQLFPSTLAKKIPAIYSQESVKDPIAWVKLFSPYTNAVWYITEYDPSSREAFGWADLGMGGGELGYISIRELEGLHKRGLPLVERDLYWKPMPLSRAKTSRVASTKVAAPKGGHFVAPNGKIYVDTAFLNSIRGIPNTYLDHMGFGEFYANTPKGRVDFDRMRGVEFPGQSGRSHQMYGEGGSAKWLLEQMIAKGQTEEAGGRVASAGIRTARLMKRQEDILQKYLADAARRGVRAATGFDELPDTIRTALRHVKDQETLWSDVDRWFWDNAPANRYRFAKFPKGVEMTVDEVADVVGLEFKEMNENPPESVVALREEMESGKKATLADMWGNLMAVAGAGSPEAEFDALSEYADPTSHDQNLASTWEKVSAAGIPVTLKKNISLKDGTTIGTGSRGVLRFVEMSPHTAIVDFDTRPNTKLGVTNLAKYFGRPFMEVPSIRALSQMSEGISKTVTGKRVEPDGYGPDGSPSWLLVLGMI